MPLPALLRNSIFLCVSLIFFFLIPIHIDGMRECIRAQVNLWHSSILWGFIPSFLLSVLVVILYFDLYFYRIFVSYPAAYTHLYFEFSFFFFFFGNSPSFDFYCTFIFFWATLEKIQICEKKRNWKWFLLHRMNSWFTFIYTFRRKKNIMYYLFLSWVTKTELLVVGLLFFTWFTPSQYNHRQQFRCETFIHFRFYLLYVACDFFFFCSSRSLLTGSSLLWWLRDVICCYFLSTS